MSVKARVAYACVPRSSCSALNRVDLGRVADRPKCAECRTLILLERVVRLHAGCGVYGLRARRSHEQSACYMQATAGVFGTIMAMGYNNVRGRDGTCVLMGMAIDQVGNNIHTAWTGIGLAYSLDPHLGESRRAPPAEA